MRDRDAFPPLIALALFRVKASDRPWRFTGTSRASDPRAGNVKLQASLAVRSLSPRRSRRGGERHDHASHADDRRTVDPRPAHHREPRHRRLRGPADMGSLRARPHQGGPRLPARAGRPDRRDLQPPVRALRELLAARGAALRGGHPRISDPLLRDFAPHPALGPCARRHRLRDLHGRRCRLTSLATASRWASSPSGSSPRC